MKVIYILGSGHCGTTLLDLILDSHDKIVGLGQCEKIGIKQICACGKGFSECSFWRSIREKDIGIPENMNNSMQTTPTIPTTGMLMDHKTGCIQRIVINNSRIGIPKMNNHQWTSRLILRPSMMLRSSSRMSKTKSVALPKTNAP